MRAPMVGPKSRDEWIRVYEERDSDTEYVTYPGEQMAWHPMHGFFTYFFDPETRLITIPKMCGDGKYWRKVIFEMAQMTRQLLGTRGVYCCTKRNPKAYMRILGGELVKQEHRDDGTVLSYIFITFGNTKEGRNC
jgi:hypothetical protein